jgi:hypothetical protein
MLKVLLGAFADRFWSRYLERQSRKPKKNATLKAPHHDHRKAVDLLTLDRTPQHHPKSQSQAA